MKQVAVIGIGMSAATATAEALSFIRQADVLLGAKRMTDEFAFLGKPVKALYRPDEVEAAIRESGAERFAVLVSGDVGFYSGAAGLVERLGAYDLKLIPGVSSVSYFFAKCGLPWQDAALVSCHGTDTDLVGAVRRNRLTFALTGDIARLSDSLCVAGFGHLPVTAGENLGLPGERMTRHTAESLREHTFSSLSVLLIENETFDARARTGIPDDEFIRGESPMTKAEVRAACLSKLAVRPEDLCYDIGCGTGSVTVELALSAYRGRVYAIDRNEEALTLTRRNCARFHIGNVETVCGAAPEIFSSLPAPDAAFIGGSGGRMDDIFRALLLKNPHVRLVVTAVALETVSAAAEAFRKAGIEPEIVQISVARAKKAGELHMMIGQNPVFLLSGGGR